MWWGWDGGEVRKMRETKEVAVQDSCGGVRKGRRRGSAKETYKGNGAIGNWRDGARQQGLQVMSVTMSAAAGFTNRRGQRRRLKEEAKEETVAGPHQRQLYC